MSFTPAEKNILEWLNKKGNLVIEANDEYYITLECSKGKYMYHFGDTPTKLDSEYREMHEEEVIKYLQMHIAGKAKAMYKKKIFLVEDIWKFIQENPNL